MTSRREFLQASLIASALPAMAKANLAAEDRALPTVELYKVVYDTRFPASVAFARRAQARRLAVQPIRGDMTGFWYDDLYHRWRQSPAAIAGLTAHGALFCLERLAWEQRMRVVYRGAHLAAADGRVAHRFEGPPSLLLQAADSVAAPAWAAALADVVAACPLGGPQQNRQGLTKAASTPPSGEELFSWVIAPCSDRGS
jgi:hypothetical protein